MPTGGVASRGNAVSTDHEEDLDADPKPVGKKVEVLELAISARRVMQNDSQTSQSSQDVECFEARRSRKPIVG
jgi:hypothetical protein